MCTRRSSIAFSFCALALAWFVLAQAATATTINFDDLANGTVVSNQYTGVGVVFTAVSVLPTAHADAAAPSAPNVADIYSAGGGEFFTPSTKGTFSDSQTRSNVSMRVGELPSGGDTSALTLTGRNIAGNVVAQTGPVTVTAGAGFGTLLSMSSVNNDIYSFELVAGVSDTNDPIGFDDLDYTITGPAAADFGVQLDTTGTELLQGQSVQIPVTIPRVNGSNGRVALDISGLPQSVSGSFSPSTVEGASTSSTLTLSAAQDATPTKSTATVTATPLDAGAGSSSRSTSLVVDVKRALEVSTDTGNVDLGSCPASAHVTVKRGSLGFNDPVSLSVSGLPKTVSASFSNSVVTFAGGGFSETVTLSFTSPADGKQIPFTDITVTASSPGHRDELATLALHGACPALYDLQANSIQVFQATQTSVISLPDPNNRSVPFEYSPFVSIGGLGDFAARLARGQRTVTRIFANANYAPSGGVPDVTAELHGYRGASRGEYKNSPILPDNKSRELSQGAMGVSAAELSAPNGAFVFTLPPDWNSSYLRLRAVLLPPNTGKTNKEGRAVAECASYACKANNAVAVENVPISDGPAFSVNPLRMTVRGQPALPDPAQAFSGVLATFPGAVTIRPYQATIDVTDIATSGRSGSEMNSDVGDRVDDWDDDREDDSAWTEGINTGVAFGVTNKYWDWDDATYRHAAIAEVTRPLTSVAHELGHLEGLKHASKACGGGDNGQEGVDWPDDQRGFLQSIGLDRRPNSGGGNAYRLLFPGVGGRAQWYDFMSYCANAGGDPDSWISLHNWNVLFSDGEHGAGGASAHEYHVGGASAAGKASAQRESAAAAGSGLLAVHATVTGSGTSINSVKQRAGQAPPANSSYELVGSDANGQVLYRSGMSAQDGHVDGEGAITNLDGAVPADGVASVSIVRDGQVVASRAKPQPAPRVRMRRLPGKVGAKRSFNVRWQSSGSADRVAKLEFSPDGGRRWKPIYIGPDRQKVKLPSAYLSGSPRARFQVTIDDGFSQAAARSGRVETAAQRPEVKILSLKKGQRLRSEGSTYLQGQAFDELDRQITGKRLKWYMGRRYLGSGPRQSVTLVPPGGHTFRLLATDRRGQRASAQVSVRVAASPPRFLELDVPPKLASNARRLSFRAASSLPATLRVGGESFRVGRTVRRYTIAVKPRKQARLRFTMSAFGKRSVVRATVRR